MMAAVTEAFENGTASSTIVPFGNTMEGTVEPSPNAVSNTAELVVLTVYISFCIVAVLAGNGVFIAAVFKHAVLQTPHYALLCSYALCDVGMCLGLYPAMIVILFVGTAIPGWFCRASACLGISSFISSVYMLGLVAYERYHFFLHPMSYPRFFTTRNTACLVAAVWFVSFGFIIPTEIVLGRKVFVTVLGCQLENTNTITPIQIVGCFGPSLFAILFSTIRFAQLRRKIHHEDAKAQHSHCGGSAQATTTTTTTAEANLGRAAHRALRMVLLVSGLFWGTNLPNFVVRLAVFYSGVTWKEMEFRQNLTMMALLRTSHLVMGTVSPIFNAWLYLCTHKELRTMIRKMLGLGQAEPVKQVITST